MYFTPAVDIDGNRTIIRAKSNNVYKDDIKLEEGDMHRTPYPCRVIKVEQGETQEFVFTEKFGNKNYRPRMKKCCRCEEHFMKNAPAHVFCAKCLLEHTKIRLALWVRDKRNELPLKKCKSGDCSEMVRTYIDTKKTSGFCKKCAAINGLRKRYFNRINYLWSQPAQYLVVDQPTMKNTTTTLGWGGSRPPKQGLFLFGWSGGKNF